MRCMTGKGAADPHIDGEQDAPDLTLGATCLRMQGEALLNEVRVVRERCRAITHGLARRGRRTEQARSDDPQDEDEDPNAQSQTLNVAEWTTQLTLVPERVQPGGRPVTT